MELSSCGIISYPLADAVLLPSRSGSSTSYNQPTPTKRLMSDICAKHNSKSRGPFSYPCAIIILLACNTEAL
jgi:hypothetical protein